MSLFIHANKNSVMIGGTLIQDSELHTVIQYRIPDSPLVQISPHPVKLSLGRQGKGSFRRWFCSGNIHRRLLTQDLMASVYPMPSTCIKNRRADIPPISLFPMPFTGDLIDLKTVMVLKLPFVSCPCLFQPSRLVCLQILICPHLLGCLILFFQPTQAIRSPYYGAVLPYRCAPMAVPFFQNVQRLLSVGNRTGKAQRIYDLLWCRSKHQRIAISDSHPHTLSCAKRIYLNHNRLGNTYGVGKETYTHLLASPAATIFLQYTLPYAPNGPLLNGPFRKMLHRHGEPCCAITVTINFLSQSVSASMPPP